MSNQVTRGLLYARRSTEKQEASLETQLETLVRLAKQHGVEVRVPNSGELTGLSHRGHRAGDFFVDEVSGASSEKHGLKALVDLALHDSNYSHLFVWDFDRISRELDAEVGNMIVKQLRLAGVTVVTASKVLPPYKSAIDALAGR